MKTLMVLTIFVFAYVARSACDLKRLDNYYVWMENSTYIKRLEKEPTIYRGIATTKGKALEMAFKDLKEKKCPDKISW